MFGRGSARIQFPNTSSVNNNIGNIFPDQTCHILSASKSAIRRVLFIPEMPPSTDIEALKQLLIQSGLAHIVHWCNTTACPRFVMTRWMPLSIASRLISTFIIIRALRRRRSHQLGQLHNKQD